MAHPLKTPKHAEPTPAKVAPLQSQLDTLIMQGLDFHQQGKFNEARTIYEKVLATQPNYFSALQLLGALFCQTKQFTKAVDFLTKALQINPYHAACYYNRGNALQELGHLDEAVGSYDNAISTDPEFAEAYSNRGNALKKLGRLDEAVGSYNNAISTNPEFAEAYSNLGNALQALGHFNEALENYNKAINLRPDYVEAYSNRGNALQELGRLDEAIGSYDKAISINPNYAEAFNSRGIALKTKGLLDEALASYDKAISINPDYADAHWNLSFCNLLGGNFKTGWEKYEWGWENGQRGLKQNFSKPLWLGTESLQNKSILLHTEQGLGDTIQFCRYIPLVAELGAKVILEAQRPLVSLLKGLEGVCQIIMKGDTLPNFDYQCPLLSLPLAFKTELHTIPPIPQFIGIDIQKLTRWQTQLGLKSKIRIGLAWSSVSNFKNDHTRSITLLELLKALPEEGFEYICLQKEIKTIDKEALKANPQIQFFGNQFEDFRDTTALIKSVDMVISTCTSVPHLSCSLGKETWLLLSYSPDWRWMLGRDDSPWYPSVKLYRQERIGDWDSVLKKVQSDLLALQ